MVSTSRAARRLSASMLARLPGCPVARLRILLQESRSVELTTTMQRSVLACMPILLAARLPSLPSLPLDAVAVPWAISLNRFHGSGWLSICLLSLAAILALRLPRLERWLCGLDRTYRAHRRLAERGVGMGPVPHLRKRGSRAARRRGWLFKPEDFPSHAPSWSQPYRHDAKSVAESALFLALVLMKVAPLRRIPHSWFAKPHHLLPAAYLFLVSHGLLLIPGAFRQRPAGALAAAWVLVGSVAASISLLGRVGRRRRMNGVVNHRREIGLNVFELHCRLRDGWPKHESGPFALVTFGPREGAHPFTIASAWRGVGEIRFANRTLGDYISRLPKLLSVGDTMSVEEPYGRFVFADDKPRRLWVAGASA